MKQSEALDILKLGHNVYLTGAAGSGKTFLLNKYINYLQDYGVAVGITASTGIAATHMNGLTIHSWSGIGIKDELSNTELRKLIKKRHLIKRFASAKILIIDEVSMLHSFQLDLVDQVCRRFKQSPLPFGGLQIILCGDFFQLPPVNKTDRPTNFVHKSKIWDNMDLKICYLDEQYRQTDDKLLQILNSIRANKITDSIIKDLNTRQNQEVEGLTDLTKLHTHNIDVDSVNNKELQKVPGKTYAYTMQFYGTKTLAEFLKKSCLAPEILYLKKGATVMFVKNNFEQGYVNGTLGKVVDFDENKLPIIKTKSKDLIVAKPASWIIEENDAIKAEIIQIPLRLAWAITVHKSQGMSLEAAEIDLSKSFEPGMGYVALSRVRSLNGMKLTGLNKLALQVNEEILELDKDLIAKSKLVEASLEKNNQDTEIKQKIFLKNIVPDGIIKKRAKTKLKKERKKKMPKGSTFIETKKLILEKIPIEEIAKRRDLKESTILGHLEKLLARGEELDLDHIRPKDLKRLAEILDAFRKTEEARLSEAKEILGEDFSYDELRLARLFLNQ